MSAHELALNCNNPIGPSTDIPGFRRACSRFATGVTVVTASEADGTPLGVTVNSFTSVSCCPPLVLICVGSRSHVLKSMLETGQFAINVLSEEQRELSVRFAQAGIDRFNQVDWTLSTSGLPLLSGVLAVLECSVGEVVTAGDHAVVFGRVQRMEQQLGRPLVFYASEYTSILASAPNGRS